MPGLSIDPAISNLSPEFQKAYGLAVQAERKPLEKLEEKKAHVQEKVSLLGDVLGKIENVKKLLPNLNTPIAIRDLAVNSADPRVLTGTADKSIAEPGKYSFEIMSLAKGASAVSVGLEDRDTTTIGTGFIQFNLASGESREIFVDAENSTLDGVARLINSARMGVKANVVNDQTDPDAPFRLVLSSENQGTPGSIEYPEFYLIDGEADFYMETDSPSANAKIKYEGFEFESPTNEIKDLINGVTLSLKGVTDPGRPTSLTIEQDVPKTTVKVKELVDGVNSVFSFIQQQNALDKDSQTQKTLGGDYGIRLAEDRLRKAFQENFLGLENAGNLKILADIGVQFGKTGTLTFDEKKFQNALTANYDDTVALLVGNGTSSGLIPKLNTALSTISGPGTGLLTNQKETYGNQIKKFDQEIETREKSAKTRMDTLRDKLARAQGALSKMQSQTGQMQSMIGGGGGGIESLLNG